MNKEESTPSAKNPKNTTRIHIKLKKDLKAELAQKAADSHMSLSQLLLQSARNSTITIKVVAAPKNSKEFLAMTSAYNKFGAQLNMLVKHCNTYKANSDSVQVISALIDIERAIQTLSDQVIGEAHGDARIQ
ncbi:ribbon-helix-helix protein, CopG family [Pseudomonas aeruginosa]|uniref:plasmid mobilization protein n=1 Tax=Pseudomonas aeruginosa TaxID=287 RepID=UPI000FFEAA8C|nr:ribbon-helix-helix protein, CopG family [Pseudomonas aeruginosa]MBA5079724.1 ribbon-helix-helix protein, CopG family [Pseudomonas aeruginosa]MCO3636957.1 ribbon-helix-helix protein, CopG family [Pseudomonas aeruginosa]MDI2267347.1 ribbon-helix-helix protein, CopG family [Pseudomonas aeruginosa]MDI2279008.1 ribbon-helix-helix protein, CopG family [Pseudomonas aeruginosa]MDI2291544.1 ribbon-helix-helix protein, CopG family [Pseudomonas aeruginosa]